MDVRHWALVLALIPAGAQAQQVYKCVKGKEVAYQSEPCASGQEPAKTWQHGTYTPPPNSERWRVYNSIQATNQRDAELRAANNAAAAASVGSSVGRCDAAKQTRDRNMAATRPTRGSHSIETRRSWDEYVASNCR
ncbi:DUF4124 domain-containing protein [Xanthomonas sp. XNM01]|uniref:DUF4124 domain-containing protein n=1 Tax=Xanthomonas sp. XNM01 TaxID=2769289 RepID=UPI001784FC52|nr:DUF4124 domain-containing protein [Xanthomonas sp. XNM01]MBD9368362.1 DUF4124 domain-containing protein [Xanthomonas sp. XNM01]